MIRISNIKIYDDLSEEEVFNFVLKKYNISKNDVLDWKISKKSIDARRKKDIHYNYSLCPFKILLQQKPNIFFIVKLHFLFYLFLL